MSGIEISNLSKSFGAIKAIRDITLSIADGAFCIFLGPSGCGKSTTLNIIAGLEEASAGTIKIAGRDVTQMPPHDRDIAMVFQSSLLYPHLTALQNIEMSLRNTPTPPDEVKRRIDYAVDILDIQPVLGKKPGAISGGERQRVAMAKAIVRKLALFLLDEPLASLDAALRQSLRSDLVALQKKLGTTTIFVTHDQVEAMTMGDVIVVMNKGRVEQIGSPDQIYNAPASRFVADFIGSPPANFFEGKILNSSEGPVLDAAVGPILLPSRLIENLGSREARLSLCLRPQHTKVSRSASPSSIELPILGIEYLGKESVLILGEEGKGTYRAIVEPDHGFKIDERAHMSLDLAHAILFFE